MSNKVEKPKPVRKKLRELLEITVNIIIQQPKLPYPDRLNIMPNFYEAYKELCKEGKDAFEDGLMSLLVTMEDVHSDLVELDGSITVYKSSNKKEKDDYENQS